MTGTRAGMSLGRLSLLVILCVRVLGAQTGSESRTVRFRETDTVFTNPGQGWMYERWVTPRMPSSVEYLRFDWLEVEPADGSFDWAPIDRAIARARANHRTVAMRVMTANAHSAGEYSSPKWLFDEGCRSFAYTNDGSDAAQGGKAMTRLEPDYGDPIYLARHGAFMRAFGERYNGSADVEFLDIGSYGIWGEWHTTHPVPVAVRRQIVDMYLKAFNRTPLVYMSDDAEVMGYALANGAGLRRDGVGSPWHEQRWAGTSAYANVPAMGDAWKHAPIIFEWFLDYNYMAAKGWSFDAAVEFMLRNHVTMIHDNLGAVPQDAMPQMEKLARLAGYRFVLRGVREPAVVHAGEAFELGMTWANVGVGKLYRAYELRLRVCDDRGQIITATVVNAEPSDWLPGEYKVAATVQLPAVVEAGNYRLEVSLRDGSGEHPPLHLAIDAPEKDGWYEVGTASLQDGLQR